jgi:2-polyprenyl-6-methoxyphenol hydroxylase-like FAD-dependent oxidoreductase
LADDDPQRTQVAIIGAGPAGLRLGRLLEQHGIESGDPRGAHARLLRGPHPCWGARAGHADLAEAFADHYNRSDAAANNYSDRRLERVWRAQHFSWWMTQMLHPNPSDDAYADQLSRAQLRYVCNSTAAAISLAENYVGLPFESPLGR